MSRCCVAVRCMEPGALIIIRTYKLRMRFRLDKNRATGCCALERAVSLHRCVHCWVVGYAKMHGVGQTAALSSHPRPIAPASANITPFALY